jgi:hypothetical protein
MTIIYCLRFETSLFVACYDSQDSGGGIRPRLHTGGVLSAVSGLALHSCGTENAEISSTADHTENTSHVIAKHCWVVTPLRMRTLHGHKENTAALFLSEVTAYAEVCLPSRCPKTGSITPMFYCFLRVLLRNVCFYGSTVLAWSKYAVISSYVHTSCLQFYIHFSPLPYVPHVPPN